MRSIGETLKPISKVKDWDEIAKDVRYQNAHCAECGKPVPPRTAAQSFDKYRNVFCSGECKDKFMARKARRNAQPAFEGFNK